MAETHFPGFRHGPQPWALLAGAGLAQVTNGRAGHLLRGTGQERRQLWDVGYIFQTVHSLDDLLRSRCSQHRLHQNPSLGIDALGLHGVLLGTISVGSEMTQSSPILRDHFHLALRGASGSIKPGSATRLTSSFTASTAGSDMRSREWADSKVTVPSSRARESIC